MLLARLWGVEAHGVRHLGPGQTPGAGHEQQTCLKPVDLSASGREKGERAQDVLGRQVGGAPEGELQEVDRRRRYWRRPPRPGVERVRAQAEQALAAVLFPACLSVISLGRIGDGLLAGHGAIVQTQHPVVNVLLPTLC